MRSGDLKASRFGWAREKTLRPLTLITLLVLVSIIASTIYPARVAALTSHPPISIVGNTGFNNTAYHGNGVTSGNGSASNPYIIEGWDITTTTLDGVHVEYTNASFIIRNVYIHGPSPSNGIFFRNVDNGLVDKSTVTNSYDGITILLSSATVENCVISSSGEHGIRVLDSKNVSIFNNTITLSMRDGIYTDSLNNTVISENRISNNIRDGIDVYRSTFVLLVLDNLTYNGVGVNLGGSTNNLVHHNNFLYNSVQALDNETGKNMWDVGYASGGNYWSDYNGVDHCSGPAQNVCTKSDGIGDTAYRFATAQDNYPLMKLFVQTVIHDVAVSSITPSAMSVNQSETLSITVVVKNEGAATENFTLTLYYDSTLIGSRTIPPLAPSASQTVLFDWNTIGVPAGVHTLKAVASTVWGEIDVADNTLVMRSVEVKIPPVTTPTPPSSPPTTQPSSFPPSYLLGGIALLFIVSVLAIKTRRTRHNTRRSRK
jgi:parallel beta-helix repeat protein